MARYTFPEWTETLKKWVLLLAAGAPVYLIALIAWGVTPETIRIGYMPEQPVPYSHALHVGELGLDCLYCHTSVDSSAKASVPPATTCMNCHAKIRSDSPLLEPVRAAFNEGKLGGAPIAWKKVHLVPNYVYFNHSAHVTRGIGCESCHGRVDQMPEVYQAKALTMGWCLDCHRQPEAHLREPGLATVMGFEAPNGDQLTYGAEIREKYNINPNTNCSTCHR